MSASDITAPQYSAAVLQWYLDNGVDELMDSAPVNRLAEKVLVEEKPSKQIISKETVMVSSSDLKAEAAKLANAAQTLDELKVAIQLFEGLTIKKTAMNMVFATGNPSATVMVIGDAPESEDDRAGVPFSGEVGALTDKMFGAIGLSRSDAEPTKSIYLTNVMSWRPPGNRTPNAGEIDLSSPFIRRHIELVKPKVIYLMGGVAAKAVLGSDLSIGKLRGKLHQVTWDGFDCPAMVSYHPSFLLRSPTKKREAWEDLLLLKEKFLQS